MSQTINEDALLRISQVLELIPISRSAWWQGCKSGKYPKPIKIGPKTTVFHAVDRGSNPLGDAKKIQALT